MLIFGTASLAFAASVVAQAGIYSCTDAKGRAITADRPIPECTDRAQRELSSTGLLKRQMGPSLTAHEQAAHDEKAKQLADIRAREAEERRRDKALLLRYPTPAVHDQERAAALQQIDEVIKASNKRKGELADQRMTLAGELEFYVKDLSKTPGSLKRRLEENDSSALVQQKFIADQDQEKKRVDQRFNEEFVKLRQLWLLTKPPAVISSSGSSSAKN